MRATVVYNICKDWRAVHLEFILKILEIFCLDPKQLGIGRGGGGQSKRIFLCQIRLACLRILF